MAGNRIESIQGYRFLLFLSVFLFHAISCLFSLGWGGGVQAFLVLSSYFVTLKYFDHDEIRIGNELIHRIKRLYPSYLFLIAGASLFYIAISRKIPYDVPIFLLSAQNFFWVAFGWSTPLSSILGHTWYITLDIYLFILWIIVLKFIPRSKVRITCYVGIFMAIVWRVMCNLLINDATISYTIPFGQLDSYCMGALVALDSKTEKLNKKLKFFDITLGIIGIAACIFYAGHIHNLSIIKSYLFFGNSSNYTHDPILVNIYLFTGILSAGLLRICISKKDKTLLSNHWMVTLGNWSYELYLFHLPILIVLKMFLSNSWVITVLALLITIFTTFLWNKFAVERIEKNFKK